MLLLLSLPSALISVLLNAFEYCPKLKYVNRYINGVTYKLKYDCDDYTSFTETDLIEIDPMKLVHGVQLSNHEKKCCEIMVDVMCTTFRNVDNYKNYDTLYDWHMLAYLKGMHLQELIFKAVREKI